MLRVVADLGNSRLKWGLLDASGRLIAIESMPIDDEAAWSSAWDAWNLSAASSRWAVSSVNPPAADRLRAFLESRLVARIDWFRSALDVPVPHVLEQPETAGADRALAVLAVRELGPRVRPALVISCGSAVVVDRIAANGRWEGGAIAAGLGLSARALHLLTAQLPLVEVTEPPAALGSSTGPAMAAGLFWGAVGAIRELVARQSAGLDQAPSVVWTGGDASLLAPWVSGPDAQVVPDLVLQGLARVCHGPDPTTGA